MIEQGGRAGGTSDDLCKDIGHFLNGVSCVYVGCGERHVIPNAGIARWNYRRKSLGDGSAFCTL